MPVSRRQLLQQGFVVAAAACAAGPWQAWAARNNSGNTGSPGGTQGKMQNEGLAKLSRQDFTRVIGSGFEVTLTSGKAQPVWLRLLAVNDLPALVPVNPASMAVPPKHPGKTITTTGFLLSFLGTLPKPLPQGTYNFAHPELGSFALLIVPDGPEKQTYTAVINRL